MCWIQNPRTKKLLKLHVQSYNYLNIVLILNCANRDSKGCMMLKSLEKSTEERMEKSVENIFCQGMQCESMYINSV